MVQDLGLVLAQTPPQLQQHPAQVTCLGPNQQHLLQLPLLQCLQQPLLKQLQQMRINLLHMAAMVLLLPTSLHLLLEQLQMHTVDCRGTLVLKAMVHPLLLHLIQQQHPPLLDMVMHSALGTART